MNKRMVMWLSAITVVGAVLAPETVSASRVPEAKALPLVVSAVNLSDLTACVREDGYGGTRVADSDLPCASYPRESARYTTGWVFSVKNPNSKVSAKSVRVRLRMLDKSGNEVVNKVVKAANIIFPGQTVWVAPTFDGVNADPWEWEISETSGRAVTATATVLPVKWGTVERLRTPTVESAVETRAAQACTQTKTFCSSYDLVLTLRHLTVSFNGIIPNPSKAYEATLTRVLFADDGTPLLGYRNLQTISKGANPKVSEITLPASLAKLVSGVKYFVSR